ncbi:omega-hydroxyceramide transacylase isoform X1 [Solea solea]|uniref:omega-hydroxyceramide transacylase isoform X1 n=1 Tax=Solea solea TaxID=90069 RepID=UPI00272A324B|nr:omega-hydroxyceramide transacylase isoform X1 [Solea solea]
MASSVFTGRYGKAPPSISFSGSGFMATYQLGAAQCLLNYVPWMPRAAPYVLGASAGSLVAAAVVCEMSPITIRDEIITFARQLKALRLGPFNPSINVFHWLEYVLNKHLRADTHQLASGRLAVAMTRLSDGKHVVTTDFQSKDDVVQALLCSCFVPGYCGILPPSFKGVYYLDGGFSGMQPVPPAPCSDTLTVSPFSGETDICPSDRCSKWDMVVSGATLKANMENSVRALNALYPMTLETLEEAYYRGYKDTIDFLQRNDLAPYLIMSQGSLNCPPDNTWTHLETSVEEEDEVKVEDEAAPASFISDGQKDNIVLQSTQRKAMFLLLLTWHCLRHSVFFFLDVFFSSVKKNMQDRLMPVFMLLKWLKIQTQAEGESESSSSSPGLHHSITGLQEPKTVEKVHPSSTALSPS